MKNCMSVTTSASQQLFSSATLKTTDLKSNMSSMGHQDGTLLCCNSMPASAQSRTGHYQKSRINRDGMDILKLFIEILHVAGEKTDRGLEKSPANERPKSETNSRKPTSEQDHILSEERQKKPWKWRKKSNAKIKIKSSESDTNINCKSIDASGRLEEATPINYNKCTNINDSTCSSMKPQEIMASMIGLPFPTGYTKELPISSTPKNPSASKGPFTSNTSSDNSSSKNESSEESTDSMSMLQKLALTALNLTAPASSVLLNNRRNSWVQLSGHPGCLAPAGPGTIWKKRSGETNESIAYKGLMKDVARDIVPTFYKEVVFQGEYFIEMRDLLYDFNNPCLMDIKIGTRTFHESEVLNKKARSDLYQKMIKVDPSSPTEEERTQQAVTKLRYMDFRDTVSSSRSLGFRVEALKMSGSKDVTAVRTARTREEVQDTISGFLRNRDSVKRRVLARLKEIKSTFESSPFFKQHEVVGSSILIIYDEDKVGAWIIDFAKTLPLPDGITINHTSPWVLGNHEEGYITGLENLIKAVDEVPIVKSRKIPFFGR